MLRATCSYHYDYSIPHFLDQPRASKRTTGISFCRSYCLFVTWHKHINIPFLRTYPSSSLLTNQLKKYKQILLLVSLLLCSKDASSSFHNNLTLRLVYAILHLSFAPIMIQNMLICYQYLLPFYLIYLALHAILLCCVCTR